MIARSEITRVAEYLKKQGIEVVNPLEDGEIMCKCPMHDDSTPSLAVNAETGKYQCFAGCFAGHSIEDLLFKAFGVVVEDITIANPDIELKLLQEKFKNIYKTEKKIEPKIPKLPLAIGNEGESFLFRRKIIVETIEKYGIMWWEEQRAIVIPLDNVGYVLRFVDSHITKTKYKYVAGTRITDSFWGYNDLDIDSYPYVVLVEGALDAIYLRQIGVKNSLGLMHNDLSGSQKQLLTNLGNSAKIYLMLDNDEGGVNGANKIREKLRGSFVVKTVYLPQGKDPNDCTIEEIAESVKKI